MPLPIGIIAGIMSLFCMVIAIFAVIKRNKGIAIFQSIAMVILATISAALIYAHYHPENENLYNSIAAVFFIAYVVLEINKRRFS
jgi:hypothetical protein